MKESLFLLCVFAAAAALAQDPSLVLADGGLQFPDGTVQLTAAAKGSAPVEDTGQKLCWDQDGNPVDCPFTFQDGDFQAGVDWPAPRFSYNADGTVTDNLTGLIWLQDADCFGLTTWQEALDAVTALALGSVACQNYPAQFNLGWRLPNIKELLSLVDYGQSAPALPVGHPFIDVQSVFPLYWASSSVVSQPGDAWGVSTSNGRSYVIAKTTLSGNVWPVRGGQ